MPTWEDFKLKKPKFSNIDVASVQNLVNGLRNGLACSVADKFESGVDNVAFNINFTDGVQWICRVRGERLDHSPAYSRAKLNSSVATMRYVKANSSIPIPTVYAHASQVTTPGLGTGYIVMEYMSGYEVDLDDDDPDIKTAEDQRQIYQELARITNQLWRLRFNKIGPIYENESGEFYIGPFVDEQGKASGPFDTAVDFFKSKIPGIRTSFENWLETKPDVSESDRQKAATMCTLYERVANELSDHDYGIFPLTHGDLGTHNVLFIRDQSGQLKINAVLDWDYSHASAWPDFGQFPAMLEVHWPTFEKGEYSSFVLKSIRHQQLLYLDGIANCQDPFPSDGFPALSNIIDTPAVRVAEFVLLYSNPKGRVDLAMVLKFIRDWRSDWEH
jgi:hypothetical protein